MSGVVRRRWVIVTVIPTSTSASATASAAVETWRVAVAQNSVDWVCVREEDLVEDGSDDSCDTRSAQGTSDEKQETKSHR